jgi:2-keto-4-pentenoate hydratase/2-oxohepta-3-ene-1,7-dioic acid hydratase in catechol pathway
MRLITFHADDAERIGAWIDSDRRIVDLAEAARLLGPAEAPAFASMRRMIAAGEAAWEAARWLIDHAPAEAIRETCDVRLRAPLPRPTQIRDFLTFERHLLNARKVHAERAVAASPDPDAARAAMEASGALQLDPSFYEYPVYYTSNRLAVIGPEDTVRWPVFSAQIDYELEWAAVIGLPGEAITPAEAKRHIFGYTIFNDWSARDEQLRAMSHAINLGPGAGKDFANAFGPCIVTPDELPDPPRQTMVARINGEEWSRGNTAEAQFGFEDLIVHISRGHAIHPGEILGSGTVGTGCGIELGRLLAHGDVVELEVEGIGVLRNRVSAPHLAGD